MPTGRVFQGAAVGLAAGLFALFLWGQGLLGPLEAITWQWRAGLFAKPVATSASIRIMALDQQSLDWGKRENGLSWPWPREVYDVILAFCRRGQAKVVALDVLFSESSLYGVADDQALINALGKHRPVVGSLALSTVDRGEGGWPDDIHVPALKLAGGSARPAPPRAASFAGGSFPVPEIANSFTLLANVTSIPDGDGVFRRVPPLTYFAGQPLPSLGLAAYLAANPASAGLAVGPDGVTVAGKIIPIDANGAGILRYRGPSGTYRTLSAAGIVQSELRLRSGEKPVIDPLELKDAYVFLGLTAPGLFDLRPTPIDGVYPGVEIHATMLDNLLNGDFLRDAPQGVTAFLTLFFAVLAGVLMRFCRTAWQSLLVCFLLSPLSVLVGFAAYPAGWWLPVAVIAFGVFLALGGGAILNFVVEGRQRRYIKRAFQQYLHPAVIEQLVSQPERLNLGGEKRQLTIFFADLQGFSSISEQLDPETLTALLNDFLTAMTDIIQGEGGTIDKYEGDAIVAFWNAPLVQNDHALRGVRAAIACQLKLAELRPDFRSRYGHDLFMRIGINTGPAVVGNLGSRHHFNYTMLGDAVNLAARIEGINKQFGTYTLISEMTLAALSDAELPVREISRVTVVGRSQPIRIYEPLVFSGEATGKWFACFAGGLAFYYRGRFAEAGDAFAAIAADDPPAAVYVEQCRRLSADPPAHWDGVWRLTAK